MGAAVLAPITVPTAVVAAGGAEGASATGGGTGTGSPDAVVVAGGDSAIVGVSPRRVATTPATAPSTATSTRTTIAPKTRAAPPLLRSSRVLYVAPCIVRIDGPVTGPSPG